MTEDKLTMDDVVNCFYQPENGIIIDLIHPITGQGIYGHQTLEQAQVEYEGAAIWTINDASRHKADAYKAEPKLIDEDRFIEMLEVLPPVAWVSMGGTESFKISERYSGNITSIFCRMGKKYYELMDDIRLSHDDICQKCSVI